MKMTERDGTEAATEPLAVYFDSDKGSNGLADKMENESTEYPCGQCGYVTCVCELNRPVIF